MAFKQVTANINLAQMEEEILTFWKEDRTFEKSIESRPEDKKWNFLDGPPFVTGIPHYGSLLSSIPKDVFGRFWTMKGHRVQRVWGWDGHGLPIENKVENKLHIKRKKDIEEVVGVKKFIEECLIYVNQVSSDWEWYVDHIGRWVDFKHAYKTWDLPYMESVLWVFKKMYEKKLIYKGLRVSLYCPHCSTPISNFEVAMDAENYKQITETADTYKYQLKDEPDTYLLAWSTTPWNKLVTPALAINPSFTYLKVSQNNEKYILAKSTLNMLKGEYKILEEIPGEKLLNREFVPHYDFNPIDEGKNAFRIIGGDFVTADEGTGIVTIAAYGAEDLEAMKRENIQIVLHVDDEGRLIPQVPNGWGGMYYLDVNPLVNEDLSKRGLLYDEHEYTHSMPHCWRCGTRLFYAPKNAWFVDIQSLKPLLFKNNEPVNWYPAHFKYGRFTKSMEAAPDWNISRNRYWGSPVPVWECSCGETYVPGSIKELEELSGMKITNLHKPDIDDVYIKCTKCAQQAKRVPEVLDSWIEAGSAAFGERHYPFKEGEKREDFFPPDFVAEYTGQIRAWFYVMHVIATALFDSPAFKNVLVEGVLLGTDGRKMSKNYGNYPDPRALMEKYGGDALRIYLLGSPVMKGEDVNFSNDGVPEVVRGYLLILWNSYKYFVDYANIFGWSCERDGTDIAGRMNILDKWILARLTQLCLDLNKAFENYDTFLIVRLLRDFAVSDLSTWYIRRSRDRISNNPDSVDRGVCLSVLYGVLVTYAKLLAPIAPFISEEIYKNLVLEDSVHLSMYPQGDKSLLNEKLISDMKIVRQIVEMGHALRKEAGIKLRQPLGMLTYSYSDKLDPQLEKIVTEELNVKQIGFTKKDEVGAVLDTTITESLAEEGKAREFIRLVQQMRKDQGLTLKDKIEIKALEWPKKYEDMILRATAAVKIYPGDTLAISVIED